MKVWRQLLFKSWKILGSVMLFLAIAMFTGCKADSTAENSAGNHNMTDSAAMDNNTADNDTANNYDEDKTTDGKELGEGPEGSTEKDTKESISKISGETAKDAEVDLKALQEENADIFAWIYIPGTEIDCPVLQSEKADDYYKEHDACGEISKTGAVYIELANLTNMCDFNTVFHGSGEVEGERGPFADLYEFANPDFFDEHKTAYLYLDGNLLTYELFAAFERENTSLIRTYDFTYFSGCQKFLDDLYGARVMGRNFREGWEDLTPYHFLITLTAQKSDNPDKQFVVIGGLVNDAAGTIDRLVYE